MWRIFTTEADCQAWCDAQFVVLVRQRADESNGILMDFTDNRQPVDVTNLPDTALTADRFPLMGKNSETGEWNTVSGFTTAWAEPRQTADGRWAAPCRLQDDPDGLPEPEWPTSAADDFIA